MGRILPFCATVIAFACAMLLFCLFPALAQTPEDDRYGFSPVPGLPATQQQPPAAPLGPVAPNSIAAPYGYVAIPPSPPLQNSNSYRPVATAPNYAQPAAAGQNVMSGYMLGPGEKVRVSVFGEDDLSGEYQIDSSGVVRLPLIGTIRAAGLTAPALENAITGALAQGYLKNPRVNVEVAAYRPFYIMGAVNRPGEYPYVANMTALNAVGFGGGFTDAAKTSTIYVRHEGSPQEIEMPASQLTMIYPGDVVRVKTTLFWDAMAIFSPLAGPAALLAAAARP